MKFILGKKLKMTQIFDETGRVVPATLIEAGPCVVSQIKTKEKDGYKAIQVGFDKKRAKNIAKPQKGHLAQVQKSNKDLAEEEVNLRYLREFRVEKPEEFKLGSKITADVFAEGDKVRVIGISKGKGFQGVVKRHGFAGAPATHGTKHNLRAPGSIGSAFPERVWKGRRMAGRMGYDTINLKGTKVVQVDKDNNLLAIKGSLPGRTGTLLRVVER